MRGMRSPMPAKNNANARRLVALASGSWPAATISPARRGQPTGNGPVCGRRPVGQRAVQAGRPLGGCAIASGAAPDYRQAAVRCRSAGQAAWRSCGAVRRSGGNSTPGANGMQSGTAAFSESLRKAKVRKAAMRWRAVAGPLKEKEKESDRLVGHFSRGWQPGSFPPARKSPEKGHRRMPDRGPRAEMPEGCCLGGRPLRRAGQRRLRRAGRISRSLLAPPVARLLRGRALRGNPPTRTTSTRRP